MSIENLQDLPLHLDTIERALGDIARGLKAGNGVPHSVDNLAEAIAAAGADIAGGLRDVAKAIRQGQP